MNISVFCGATLPHNKAYIDAARQLGRLIALEGHTLLYGGSNLGLMGVVSSAALAEGGTVVGGLGSAVAEWLTLHHCNNRLRMLGVQDEFVHQGTVAELYERCGMDAQSLEAAINEELEAATKP